MDVLNRLKDELELNPHTKNWQHRPMICVPQVRYIKAAQQVLDGQKILLDCPRLVIAQIVLRSSYPVHFKLNYDSLRSADGLAFLEQAKRQGADVYVETGSATGDVWKWCILAQVTGIITDCPELLDSLYWEYYHKDPDWKTFQPEQLAKDIPVTYDNGTAQDNHSATQDSDATMVSYNSKTTKRASPVDYEALDQLPDLWLKDSSPSNLLDRYSEHAFARQWRKGQDNVSDRHYSHLDRFVDQQKIVGVRS